MILQNNLRMNIGSKQETFKHLIILKFGKQLDILIQKCVACFNQHGRIIKQKTITKLPFSSMKKLLNEDCGEPLSSLKMNTH